MSKIPYPYAPFPWEFLSDEFIDDPIMMKLIRYILKRVRPFSHEELLKNNRRIVNVKLDPWQFIYGRSAAALECGCSEKQIRTRFQSLMASSSVSSSASSSASTYSIHTLLLGTITENEGQQLGQQLGQQSGHKQEQRTIELKEQPNPTLSVEKVCLSVGSVFSCLVLIEKLTQDEKIDLSSRFDEIDLIRATAVMKEYKKPIIYFRKFIEDAIEKNWQPKEQPKISLSSEAEKNKERIFLYAEKEKEKLKNLDLVIKDCIDHLLFGHIKIFYESKSFNKDVGQARKHFNMLDNFIQAKPIYEEEEKIVQFKQLSNILIENKQTL